MTNSEISKLLQSNSDEKLLSLLTLFVSKAEKIDSENKAIGFYMILLIVIFYFIDYKGIDVISLGPVSLTDLNLAGKFAPLMMSCLIFKYQVNSSNWAMLTRVIKFFSNKFYAHCEDLIDDELFTDYLTRNILPTNFSYELTKFSGKGNTGCFTALLFLPFSIAVLLVPLIVTFVWLYDLILTDWNSYATRVIVMVSIWVLILAVWYFFQTIKEGVYNIK